MVLNCYTALKHNMHDLNLLYFINLYASEYHTCIASVAPPLNAAPQTCLDISELSLKAALITAV